MVSRVFFCFFYFFKYNIITQLSLKANFLKLVSMGFFIFSLVFFFFCYYQVEQGQFDLIIIINIV